MEKNFSQNLALSLSNLRNLFAFLGCFSASSVSVRALLLEAGLLAHPPRRWTSWLKPNGRRQTKLAVRARGYSKSKPRNRKKYWYCHGTGTA
jgi:hypothetical protein